MASNGDPLTPRLVDLSLRVIKQKRKKAKQREREREATTTTKAIVIISC